SGSPDRSNRELGLSCRVRRPVRKPIRTPPGFSRAVFLRPGFAAAPACSSRTYGVDCTRDMNLSTRATYGLRLLYQLAKEHGGPPLQLREVSEREDISEKYLGQIVILLKSQGIVQAVRGAQGGYYLSRAPALINLLDVIEALEGEILPLDEYNP